jgi:hypothetical protein
MIVAFDDNDTVSFEYGGVIWKVAPLPFGIKKSLMGRSATAIQSNSNIADLVDVAIDAIKYGLKGWNGLKYSDGRDVACVLTKDKNGVECLDQKCVEMIYRTSAFDKLSKYCQMPHEIPPHMVQSVEMSKEQEVSGPEPLDDKKK